MSSRIPGRGTKEHDYLALSEARRFDRIGSYSPCILLFGLLVFLLVNLADSKASGLTGGEVGVAVGVLAFYAFVVVPMIIFFRRGEPVGSSSNMASCSRSLNRTEEVP